MPIIVCTYIQSHQTTTSWGRTMDLLVILFFVISCSTSFHIGYSAVKEKNTDDITTISVLLNKFQDSHHDHLSILQDSSLNNNKKISLIKSIYEESKYLTFFHFTDEKKLVKMKNNKKSSLLIFVNDNIIHHHSKNQIQQLISGLNSVLFIFEKDSSLKHFEELYNSLIIRIDQKVYFFKMTSKELFENYQINRIKIQRKLGQILPDTFLWESGIVQSFVKRRSNFHGLKLKGKLKIYQLFVYITFLDEVCNSFMKIFY